MSKMGTEVKTNKDIGKVKFHQIVEAVRQYIGSDWETWVDICKFQGKDPILDGLYEFYESKAAERILGYQASIDDLIKLPTKKGELINAASHAIACLMVTNDKDDPYCARPKDEYPDKCRYCSLTPYLYKGKRDGNT